MQRPQILPPKTNNANKIVLLLLPMKNYISKDNTSDYHIHFEHKNFVFYFTKTDNYRQEERERENEKEKKNLKKQTSLYL